VIEDTETVAALAGVDKTYGEGETAVAALQQVDVILRSGELVVVLGPSGSGKTTLLNVIGGIEPPTAGKVTLGGRRIDGLGSEDLTEIRRSAVGFVFQFFNLIPTLTARENVSLLAELTGHNGEGRVDEVLAAVGLTERADHFPGQLSGGQQQRVAIARALVKGPPLLLCDEPTGALDLDTGRSVLELLQTRSRDAGETVMIVTHNSAIARMADRVVTMRSGRMVEDLHNPAPIDASDVEW
jgi:putative ABC transport system ATP-binding protein